MTTQSTAVGRAADVIVVGAGPGGSTTAAYLAQAGLDVVLLEKTAFPREKVCGDGLTPRAVRQLIKLGIDLDEPGWIRNQGLRIIGGGHQLELKWPDLSEYPDFGLVRTRLDFDDILARQAQKYGAHLHELTKVTGPLFDERTGRIVGVKAQPVDEKGHRAGDEQIFTAPVVVAADGNSTRLSLAAGRDKRPNRPMGVAVRTYYTSPRHDDDWLESWLELWDGKPHESNLLPGYGWVFGVGDGTSNVGLGILNTSAAWRNVDYKALLKAWLDHTPEEWGYRDENMVSPVRGAALPMGFNRKPHYADGLLLVGDAGGMVNPFNGEGIAYAMESGEMAADAIAQALSRTTEQGRERALGGYVTAVDQRYGGYYTIGRVFVRAIGQPGVMQYLTKHGLHRPTLMRFTLKLLANLTDLRDGDAMDRLVNGLSKMAPTA